MKQIKHFESLQELIEHLKGKHDILAIVQYGSRDYTNMEPGGDFDVNLIVRDTVPSRVCGLHFHVKQIPVDCGIIKIKDLKQPAAPTDFHCTLVNSRLLFDRTGIIAELLSEIRDTWKIKTQEITESELSFNRFIRPHIVDKFEDANMKMQPILQFFSLVTFSGCLKITLKFIS